MAHKRQKNMSPLNANEKSSEKLINEADARRTYINHKDVPSILKDSLSKFEEPNDKFDNNCDLQSIHASLYPKIELIELEDNDPVAGPDGDDNDKGFLPAQNAISSSSSHSMYSTETGVIRNASSQLRNLEHKTADFQNQNRNNDGQSNSQHCEYVDCTLDVFSTCAKCFCFLCWEHFDNITSYDNCQYHIAYNTDQTLSKRSKKKNSKHDQKTTAAANTEKVEQLNQKHSIQHCEYVECNNEITSSCINCSCFLCVDHFRMYTLDNSCNNHNTFSSHKSGPELYITKRGKISKRKVFTKTLEERKEKIKRLKLERFAIKDPCDKICKKKCASNISQERRQQLHDEYNSLDWEAQGIFIKGLVTVKEVQRRKQTQILNLRRTATYAYHFLSEDSKIPVCKKFFLTTLGFKANNDRRVLSVLKKSISDQKNKRGSYTRIKSIDKGIIKAHIIKYRPVASHYRREHAPNRLYLPSDITIKFMYDDFCREYPDVKVSSEVYRKMIRKDLNISFANFRNEECENCCYFQQHDKNHVIKIDDTCNICIDFMEHKLKYTTSRQEYQRDVQKAITTNNDTMYYSVDLQKVIMLPRMDQYKAAIYCPRIIAFNESFVPLDSDSKHLPIAMIWPETVSGCCQQDIISTYRAFFAVHRDIPNVVLWADNSASQNKNWTLLTFLIYLINSNEIATQTITIKYFEPGHTLMSANSFHHQVELSLQRMKKVYDFNDFSEAVKKSNSNKTVVKEMQITDFYNFPDESSQAKLKKLETRLYLKDIMAVGVQRGHFTLSIKQKHNDKRQQHVDFLKVKNISKRYIPEPTPKLEMKGIPEATKNAIIQKLVPLMPDNRRRFWCNLPVSESVDLD